MKKQYSDSIAQLKTESISHWESMHTSMEWKHLQKYSFWQKRNNEKYLSIAMERLLEIIKPLKKEDFSTPETHKKLESYFLNAILQCPFLTEEEKKYLCDSAQLNATKDFIDQFLKEDSSLSIENLGQALRNFWIANLLQAAFGKPISLSPSLYGYSMLYPYTDNLMDSLTDDSSQKNEFCRKLTLHLNGTSQIGSTPYEQRIFNLVDQIYQEFPMDAYPTVQAGLLAIHHAQAESLKQQKFHMTPYEIDLLGKSFYKGGTSLLADGFLVDPHMSDEAQRFCFGFGALLQLCDDLQDTRADSQVGHNTLFSQLQGKFVFDPLLMKMNAYLDELLTILDSLDLSQMQSYDLSHVIARNTRLLLLYAISDNEFCFTKSYVSDVQAYLPIRPKAMHKMIKKLRKGFLKTEFYQSMMVDIKRGSLNEASVNELFASLGV